MDDYEDMLLSDIEKCDEIIRAGFASRDDVWRFVGKYQTIDPRFNEGILTHFFEDNPNEVVNIEIIKGKLQVLLSIKNFSPPPYTQKRGNVNISNANTNTVSPTVILSIQQTVDVIRENGFLSESDKEELIKQLKKVEKLQKNEEDRNERWKLIKPLLSFLADKGADIAILFLPQIIQALQ